MTGIGRFRTFAELPCWEKRTPIYVRSFARVEQSVAEIWRTFSVGMFGEVRDEAV